MMGVFSQFSLPPVSTVARRTALVALVFGVVALVGLALLGYVILGLGICLGLGMALGIAPLWPRPRSITRPTPARRFTFATGSPPIPRRSLPALAGRQVTTIVWTTTPGRCPHRWPWPFIPISTMWRCRGAS